MRYKGWKKRRGGARIKTVWDNHRIPYNMKYLSMNSVAFQELQKEYTDKNDTFR